VLDGSESLINSSKAIRKETITTATVKDAWKAWTTIEGVASFFVPKANIEPMVSGRYELFSSLKAPKGFQGTEGCKILALEPQKHLAFEFIAPPQFPNVRRLLTRVDVAFGEVAKGGVVKLDLVHSGFLEGEEWDEFFEFSNWNWDLVLGRFQYRFTVGPIDWNNPYIPHGISSRPERKLRDHISA
jgi:uncharacterized protein YndB with AHSA1/START domain